MLLDDPCSVLPGVGDVLTQKLAQAGIRRVGDLVFHLPYRYQDRTRVTPIVDLQTGSYAVVVGEVIAVQSQFAGRKRLHCHIQDQQGTLALLFFHFHKAQIQNLQKAKYLRVFGEVRAGKQGWQMIHPEYQILQSADDCTVEEHLTPIYPAIEKLSQTRIRQLIKMALAYCQPALHEEEFLPAPWNTYSRLEALQLIHYPPPEICLTDLEDAKHLAMQRLIFEELLTEQIGAELARQTRRTFQSLACPDAPEQRRIFLQNLPFTLTNAQQRVSLEIARDLAKTAPMFRLVQGDVGAGKTVIAALAALQAIAAGFQAAIMAPTDILTEQHAVGIENMLAPLGIRIARLSGKMSTKTRRPIEQALANGDISLIIGTHALFQEHLEFKALGLVIIDEQHRFGVMQRLKLADKVNLGEGLLPHQLFLTATPIPRTLSMSRFSHMDLSILDELPPNRTPVQTLVMGQHKREMLIARMQALIAEGRQIYWVCPLIEESEKLQCQAATESFTTLQALLPQARVGLVHGRLKASEKETAMQAFKTQQLDILVATTVIEVGVDVPNASLMVIENAERMGLSQLHQLRGRVGRGAAASHCVLLYQNPLSNLARERLEIMRDTTDGFVIAEKDLQLRGAGELLGAQQTGFARHRLASLPRDEAILYEAYKLAPVLHRDTPEIAARLTQLWRGKIEGFVQG